MRRYSCVVILIRTFTREEVSPYGREAKHCIPIRCNIVVVTLHTDPHWKESFRYQLHKKASACGSEQ